MSREEEGEGIELEVDEPVKKETEKALLVKIEGSEYWVPKSQILDDSDVQGEGDEGTLLVTEWWADKEGLS